jgi:hypothetical protein
MSSQRKPQGRPGPAPERKAAAGPVVTPQVLIVVYLVIIIIGGAIYLTNVVKKSAATKTQIEAAISTANHNRDIYQAKRKMLPVAQELNKTVRDKLNQVQYMFLTDQLSVIPFWQEDFFPLLDESALGTDDDTEVKPEDYTFHMNMAMLPFDTLPPSILFESATDLFPIEYHGEQDGKPTDVPFDTRPNQFLTPYSIELKSFIGSYKQVRSFIDKLQKKSNRAFYTVHCIANDKEKNDYSYRTFTAWDIKITVYFINPEASASGDQPPALPGSSKC